MLRLNAFGMLQLKNYEKENLSTTSTHQVELLSLVFSTKTIQIVDIPYEESEDIDITSNLKEAQT